MIFKHQNTAQVDMFFVHSLDIKQNKYTYFLQNGGFFNLLCVIICSFSKEILELKPLYFVRIYRSAILTSIFHSRFYFIFSLS